jgi:hypothetical protein
VIIGLDGPAFEKIETTMGKITPHRAFYYALMSLWEQMR